MSSKEEQQAGPSSISREELSPLLGLNVTNNDEEEAMGEEDPSCNQTKDDFDRHHTQSLLKSKMRSIVQIRNTDVLCCARALVTAKAKVDQHPQWHSFKYGRKLQKEHALLLHRDAQVPFGPCGYDELAQFNQAPSLFDYQILLVDADRAFSITSFGSPAPGKQLVLLHDKGHYDVITSLSRWKEVQREPFKPHIKNPIYKEVLNIVQNRPDRFFENKEIQPIVIQALKGRDLHGLAQAIAISPQFYDLCQTSGLFNVEPTLRTWYPLNH